MHSEMAQLVVLSLSDTLFFGILSASMSGVPPHNGSLLGVNGVGSGVMAMHSLPSDQYVVEIDGTRKCSTISIRLVSLDTFTFDTCSKWISKLLTRFTK